MGKCAKIGLRMRSKKPFYKNTELVIVLSLLALGAVFYALGVIFCSLNGFFINLSAGCVTAIIVIFVVEYLRKKDINERSAEIQKIAKAEIGTQSNMSLFFIASPLGFLIYDYYTGDEFKDLIQLRKSALLMIDEILKADLDAILTKMSVKEWRHFAMNLTLVKDSLAENIRVYGNVLPPEVLGKLLAVRKAFKKINDYSFAVFIDLFVQEEKDWTPNKLGADRNKKLRTSQIPMISRDLRAYFSEVKEFFALLETLKFHEVATPKKRESN